MADSFRKLHERWITIFEHKIHDVFHQKEGEEEGHDYEAQQSKENQEPTLFANGPYFKLLNQ